MPSDRNESFDKKVAFIYSKKSSYWTTLEKKNLVDLFTRTIQLVPAYLAFIKKEYGNPNKVKSYQDFTAIPSVRKDSYLRKSEWKDLCKKKVFTTLPLVMTSTSGSTGKPFYFPRDSGVDLRSALYHKLFLHTTKLDPKKSVLVIDCFAMGVWIGGLITYQAFKHIGENGSPLTVITPGVNKKEIYAALLHIAPFYDQVIICGYPPFMKDLVDEAKDNGVIWSDYNLRMFFAAEGFSETFRDYMIKKTGMKNPYRDTMNIYGTADLGTMSEETPLAILIRRLAIQHIGLYTKLFGETTRLPTLTQYIPSLIQFECMDGRIYCSADSALPLVRYEIGDNGGILSFNDIESIFGKEGFDLRKEAKKVGIEDTITELPFVYIYERTDFSTKLYGAIIYPEYIKKGLQDEKLEKYITGKFTMHTKYDDKEDEYLEVNIELKNGINEPEWLLHEVTRAISLSLIEKSAEHKNNVHMMPKGKVDPRIVFWPHEHETHFKSGGKQKWVKK
jgi:phenylacetate-CoA ligase